MIYFSIPYDYTQRLINVIDQQIMSLPKPHDWLVTTDGDTMFLLSDFGHQIREYTQKFPNTGLFTCYASRCHYPWQLYPGADPNNPSMLYHHQIAKQLSQNPPQVEQINKRIAGHLMAIQKQTYTKIRSTVLANTKNKNILGVDTKISNAILHHGFKINLMKTVYIMHYLRMADGKNMLIT